MQRILIVEDNAEVVQQLHEAIQVNGYQVFSIRNFNDVILEFNQAKPDLVLMDLYLPVQNGYYWTEKIRKISQCPIIFISSAEVRLNTITALHAGADDYIEKPFDLEILMAKIAALLRRSYDFTNSAFKLTFAGYDLDLINKTVGIDDEIIVLTRNEVTILEILFRNASKLVSKEDLMQALWQTESFIDVNALQVAIRRLRAKIHPIKLDKYLETKHGQGYQLTDE